ncbi:MAG: HAD family phosphatase [Phycisphaerae bacterium]|nr:HAD family phosphatase [Phycisphaerae bacterium]
MVQAVIFDFDGVVADSELLHYKAMHRVVKGRGLDIPKDVHWEKYLGYTDYENVHIVNADYGMGWDEATMAAIVAEKTEIFDRLVNEETAIIDGVVEFVRRLAEAGIPTAVCSGATRKDIVQMLRGTELADAFGPMVTADDVTKGKPDPQGYLLALSRLNNGTGAKIEAARCVVVEDSHWGLQAAAAAGMHRVAVTNTYAAAHLRPYAEMVVARLDAIEIAELRLLCERGLS